MQRFRWIALQGSSRGFLPPLLLFAFLITRSGIPAFAADVSAACSSPVARIVSIQGSVEVLRARQNDWSRVTRLDTLLCEGDKLRTGALSRAALFIQPETLVRVDQNTNISVSQTAEETLVEFTQEDIVATSTTAHTCGAGYFITRFPRKFRVNTPHLNAAVEGTEFLVAMRCESTELSVFEGKVLAAGAGGNIFPAQSISSGQVLTIGGSEPPAVKLLVKPVDAVQWVLYYPPLSDATAEVDLPPADQCRSLPKPLDQTCLTQRAEALLRLGRVDEAQREVDEAVALDSGRGDANALRAIISIARNDKASAIEAATVATTVSPNSFRAWLALSYAQQASFKLEDSLASARKAQAIEPNSSVTNARVAELLMSLGRIKDAEAAARAAVDANPTESRARTVLGFVHLAQIKAKEARSDFEAAIERDSSDPLPRLGLGLAIIRDGKLADGREQLEIAVALDPTNSLLRSYVGKAYYEENTKERDKLALIQFGLANKLDPNDPTPWFYSAILKQAQNQPAGALDDLQKSIELNDNRTVYRSKLLLDDDQAAKNANLAQIYADLGFDQLAVVEAAKSLAVDPGNYSAHRFLSETYERLPRSNLATESERLQALLRTPLNTAPISPFRTQSNPFSTFVPKSGFTAGLGPTRTGFNEFTPLFERSGSGLVIDGMAGTRGSDSNQELLSLLTEAVAIGVGYGRFQTDGFEDNRDFAQNAYDAFFQLRASNDLSLQVEFLSSRTNRGDFIFAFDPANVIPLRIEDHANATRVGARYDINEHSNILVSGIYQTFQSDVTNLLFGLQGRFEWQAGSEEVQYTYRRAPLSIVTGLGHTDGRQELVGLPLEIESRYNNGYVYAHLSSSDARVLVIGGVSYDVFKEGLLERNVSCPKAGLIWQPSKTMTFRAAAFKAVKRPIIADQTIEPTQVAGFNQFFDDLNATVAWRYGVGLNLGSPKSTNVGLEYTDRQIETPVSTNYFDWREKVGRLYAYWPIRLTGSALGLKHPTLAFTVEYQLEKLERPLEFTGDEAVLVMKGRYVPFGITVYAGEHLSLQIRTTMVAQEGRRQVDAISSPFDVSSRFWTSDLSLNYRLPNRRGRLTIGVSNLFDRNIDYVDTDLSNPRFAPSRLVLGRLTLSF